MGSLAVLGIKVLGKQVVEMARAEHNEVVEALEIDALDQPLDMGIEVRSAGRQLGVVGPCQDPKESEDKIAAHPSLYTVGINAARTDPTPALPPFGSRELSRGSHGALCASCANARVFSPPLVNASRARRMEHLHTGPSQNGGRQWPRAKPAATAAHPPTTFLIAPGLLNRRIEPAWRRRVRENGLNRFRSGSF